MLLLALTPLGAVLGLTTLSFAQWLIVFGISFALLPVSELVKLVINFALKHKN